MLFFYVLFFWFLSNFSTLVGFNLKDNKFNLLNEFFFCIDSFSTTFIIFYLVIFFLSHDLILSKYLNIKTKLNYNFFFLKFRFVLLVFRKLTYSAFIFIYKQLKYFIFFYFNKFYGFNKIIFGFFGKRLLLWKPLFKRWSYFGLWSKKNNRN